MKAKKIKEFKGRKEREKSCKKRQKDNRSSKEGRHTKLKGKIEEIGNRSKQMRLRRMTKERMSRREQHPYWKRGEEGNREER